MANILKIKRSDNANGNAPTSLARGELAYHEVTDTLYIGSGTETGGDAANQPVVAGPLNLMPAPTANVSLNSKRLTNLAAPTAANDAVRKVDLDNAIIGLDVRDSVKLVAVANIAGYTTSAQSSALTVDSVTLAANDRILLTAQTTASQNGIWKMTYTSSQWQLVRAEDAQNASDLSANMFFFVEEGTVYQDTGWVCTTNETVTMSNMVFSQFTGAHGITAGAGLTKTGNTLSATTEAIADGGANLATADQIHTFVTGSYAGDITSVSAGTGLGGGGTTGTVNLFVDLEEVANGASDPVGNDKLVYVTGGGDTKKYAFSDVPLTIFDSATFIKDSSIIDCGTF